MEFANHMKRAGKRKTPGVQKGIGNLRYDSIY
jgi:hypothetical protein